MYGYGYKYTSGLVVGSGAPTPPPFANTKSLLFDGVNDYLDLSTSTGLNFSNDFTLSAWVKTSAIGANQFIVDASTSSSLGHGYSIRILANGTVKFWSYDATKAINSISALSVNTWYHICATHNRSGLENKIYINGVLDVSGVSGSFNPTSMANLRVGSSVLFSGTLNGNIDEPCFFDRVVTPAEITTLATAPTVSLTSLSPISWWRMGDSVTAFPTIPDAIGTNDGTAYNENESTMVVPDVP